MAPSNSNNGPKRPRTADQRKPKTRKKAQAGAGNFMPTLESSPIKAPQIESQEDDNQHLITRRRFLFGAIGAGVVATAAIGTAVATQQTAPQASVETITVPEDAVFSLDDCTEVELDTVFEQVGDYELPYGTLVWANNDKVAACLLPTALATPLAQVSLLNLETGDQNLVLKGAIGANEGFEIYDVRASASGVVWTEANILENRWRIFAASLGKDQALGQAHIIEEGDSTWETPTIAAVGDYAFWQMMPPATSDRALTGESFIKRAALSSGDSETIHQAMGRMSCPIYACSDAVVIAARHQESSSHFQLLHINAASGDIDDTLTLPSNMTPNALGYGAHGFSFSFEGIYSYGGGIANLGTYTPSSSHSAGQTYNDLNWFRFNRTPYAHAAWCTDTWFIVKSTQSLCAIDTAARTYCVFGVESGCTNWGDYLASTGTGGKVVSAMQIDQTDASGTTTNLTRVRVFQPGTGGTHSNESDEEKETTSVYYGTGLNA